MARTREEYNKYMRDYYAMNKVYLNQQRRAPKKKEIGTYTYYETLYNTYLFVSDLHELYYLIPNTFTIEEYKKILKMLFYRTKYKFNVVNDVFVYNTKKKDNYTQLSFKLIKDPYNQLLFVYDEIEKGVSQSEIYEKYYKNKRNTYEQRI